MLPATQELPRMRPMVMQSVSARHVLIVALLPLSEDVQTAAHQAGRGRSAAFSSPGASGQGLMSGQPLASLLTTRERQVAALVARGLMNREIATELVITERTVETHVANILGKLGIRSRAQVGAWAERHGLLEEHAT